MKHQRPTRRQRKARYLQSILRVGDLLNDEVRYRIRRTIWSLPAFWRIDWDALAFNEAIKVHTAGNALMRGFSLGITLGPAPAGAGRISFYKGKRPALGETPDPKNLLMEGVVGKDFLNKAG